MLHVCPTAVGRRSSFNPGIRTTETSSCVCVCGLFVQEMRGVGSARRQQSLAVGFVLPDVIVDVEHTPSASVDKIYSQIAPTR